jgi:hypothetical protein
MLLGAARFTYVSNHSIISASTVMTDSRAR